MMNNNLSFYKTHSVMTNPGKYTYLYDDLPDDLETLFKIINNVLLHRDDARELYGASSIQNREVFMRTMEKRLARIVELDPASLTIEREIKDKQLSLCRDFAVFLTSILRHKGYAARTRAGYGAYFVMDPPYRGDHWVTEYWNETDSRWVLIDANIGGSELEIMVEQMKRPLKPGINFTDIKPNDEFYLAPYSWLACRSSEIDSKLYRHNGQWYGWPMLRGNLLHDFQALNNLEMGIFDYWDDLHAKPESEMKTKDREQLDRIAEVCLDPDNTFNEMRELFEEHPRTQVLYSRLHLIGLTSEGDVETAADLLDSDLSRLIELTDHATTEAESHKAGVAKKSQDEKGPDTGLDEEFDGITILGARQNNLKNIDVRIPRNQMVVVTGVSGSGKSSLALDTIYAEGQRRYVESLSTYARQITRQMQKPDVDKVEGLNPAIAIEQRRINPDSRTTVGSITEVLDYLRVLFARTGRMHCPQCGRAVDPQTTQSISNRLVLLPGGTHFFILAPLNRFGRLETVVAIERVREQGYTRIRVANKIIGIDEHVSGRNLYKDEEIDVIIGEFTVPVSEDEKVQHEFLELVQDGVDSSIDIGKGIIHILLDQEELRLSGDNVCPSCNLTLPRLEPRLLNHNTIFGMCLECSGYGLQLQVDPELIITRPDRSILDNASEFRLISNIRTSSSTYWKRYIQGIADFYNADLELPWKDLPEGFRRTLIYGSEGKEIHIEFGAESETGSFQVSRTREIQGAIHHINRLYRQTKSEGSRDYYRQFMRQQPCPSCNGERLNKEARFVTLANRRFPEITDRNIGELLEWIKHLKSRLSQHQMMIAEELISEIEQRLSFICEVGLHYLTLNRPGPTLSGGEAQRIRLASQIGTELKGILYVLDEPTIGLHARDHQALLNLLEHLRDSGNTVLIVEHDADTMHRADWLIDIGPGAGVNGGEIVAYGTPEEVMANPDSVTGRYLSGDTEVLSNVGLTVRKPSKWINLKGARLHNLKFLDVRFPLGILICVTGVSGSGKSSLISQTLSPALSRELHNTKDVPGPFDQLTGTGQLKRVIHITQAPIGRNPRSNPGTYVGVLNPVRKLFASTDQAQEFNYPEGYFSFNSKGGRCESCEGYGATKVRMHFMADLWIPCQDCEGKRFSKKILDVQYHGRNIADVLDMDVNESHQFFNDIPVIERKLRTLIDVGLGYIKLGQSATTLSGGEAQRVKLAKELSRAEKGNTLYILDEPTVGLHFADIQKLLDILDKLVDSGNTVIVIEHNLDVIRSADWIIDLGPEGGDEGGWLVAEGSPKDIAESENSYTGLHLKQIIQNPPD